MLSVQSPSSLLMSPNIYNNSWATWRSTHHNSNDLPTPPSSVPPRRTKAHQHSAHQLTSAQAHNDHHIHTTLPPFSQLDRRRSWCSPLTPPDDEMHPPPLWRDSKPGPSRLHSPVTAHASPVHSPSPSPIEDDEDEYTFEVVDDDSAEAEMDDEEPEVQVQVDDEQHNGVVYPESEWEWQQQQRHAAQQPCPDPPQHLADWVTSPQQRSAHFIAEKVCEMVCYLWFSSSLGPGAASSRHRRERERERAKRHANGHTATSPNMNVGPLSNDRTAMLQFSASPEFVAFMQKLLETTQLSQSVIVLSLHYIYRLKERNDFTVGKQGSEFRVAVVALMLANKFVDDNTYTNKTWSEVSGISLAELNKMEREFLQGIDFRLYVDKSTYDSWLNLLRGLVLAKEREHQRWLSRRRVPSLALPLPNLHSHYHHQTTQQQVTKRNDDRRSRGSQPDVLAYAAGATQRARSTSPHRSAYSYSAAYPFTFAVPYSSTSSSSATSTAYSSTATPPTLVETPAYSYSQSARTSPTSTLSSDSASSAPMVVDSAAVEARSKRRAADAFSPTSASFGSVPTVHPPKRPTNLAVDINAALSARTSTGSSNANANSVSAHPAYAPFAESLKSLERLSLASAGASAPVTPVETEHAHAHNHHQQSQTLAAPYKIEDIHRRTAPQNLYFYTLASSPVRPGPVSSSSSAEEPAEADVKEEERVDERYYNAQGAERKARLKYSVAPSSTVQQGAGYGCGYGFGAYGAYSTSGSYPTTTTTAYHPSSYSRSTYPPASTLSTSAYSQSQAQHVYATPEQQHHHPQPSSQPAPAPAPARSNYTTLLPPLSSLALTQYTTQPLAQPVVAQSARSSPLPSFAEGYGAYATQTQTQQTHTHTQGQDARAYTPPQVHHHQHSHQQHHQHSHHQHHAYKPSVPSPLAQQSVSSVSVASPTPVRPNASAYSSTSTSTASAAAPAPFANAGPPGVVHFYQTQTPYASYTRSTHGTGSSSASSLVASSGVAVPPPASAQGQTMMMSSPVIHSYGHGHAHGQSQSVNASPLAYAYAARGRRY